MIYMTIYDPKILDKAQNSLYRLCPLYLSARKGTNMLGGGRSSMSIETNMVHVDVRGFLLSNKDSRKPYFLKHFN